MKAAQHRLVGYDRNTELEKFELAIPQGVFGDVGRFVRFGDGDPDGLGCYELSDTQAKQIAALIPRRLPAGLDFFLEAYAA